MQNEDITIFQNYIKLTEYRAGSDAITRKVTLRLVGCQES